MRLVTILPALTLPLFVACGGSSPTSDIESLAEDVLDALTEESEEDFVALSPASDTDDMKEYFEDLEKDAKDEYDYLPDYVENQMESMSSDDTLDEMEDQVEEMYKRAVARLEDEKDEDGLGLDLEDISFEAVQNVSTNNSFGMQSVRCQAYFSHDKDWYSFKVSGIYVDGSLMLVDCGRATEVE